MSFDILPAITQDSQELATLVNSAYRGDSSRNGWTTEADLLDGSRTDAIAIEEALLTPKIAILKYVEDGKILGCVELRNMDEKLYLGMLTVQPNTQGKGIGKAMLRAAEREANRQNCKSIFMTVISVRQELIDWYIRHGYSFTGERKPFLNKEVRFGLPKKTLEFVVLEKKILG